MSHSILVLHSWTGLRKKPEKICRMNKSICFHAFEIKWALRSSPSSMFIHKQQNPKPNTAWNISSVILQRYYQPSKSVCSNQVNGSQRRSVGGEELFNQHHRLMKSMPELLRHWNGGNLFRLSPHFILVFLCLKRSILVSLKYKKRTHQSIQLQWESEIL